jgi:hypothetical protein
LDLLGHRLGLAIPAVVAAQCGAQTLHWLIDGENRIESGQRVKLHPVRLACAEQLRLIGEVVVHRESLHARSPGYLGDRRQRGADLLVQPRGRGDDSLARLRLRRGAGLELVPAFFD